MTLLLLQYRIMDQRIDPNQFDKLIDTSLWLKFPNATNLYNDFENDSDEFPIGNMKLKDSMLYYKIPVTCGPITIAFLCQPVIIFNYASIWKAFDRKSYFNEKTDEILAAMRNYETGQWKIPAMIMADDKAITRN